MSKRRGVSLAELLLAMSASSVILTMSVGMIHRVMHAQSRTRSFFDGERSALRLSQQFRQDVNSARTAETDQNDLGPDVLLQFRVDDEHTIEYRRSSTALQRLLLRGSEVAAREEYAIPAETDIELRQEQTPAIVVLSLAPATHTSDATSTFTKPMSLYVEARLGANRFGEPPAPEHAP